MAETQRLCREGAALFVSEAVMTTLKAGRHHLDDDTLRQIMQVLMAPHKHKHRKLRESRSNKPQGTSRHNHRSVLNILDSLLANQIPAKGVVTIVCRIEIRKMAEC